MVSLKEGSRIVRDHKLELLLIDVPKYPGDGETSRKEFDATRESFLANVERVDSLAKLVPGLFYWGRCWGQLRDCFPRGRRIAFQEWKIAI